jgi:pantothenate kinase
MTMDLDANISEVITRLHARAGSERLLVAIAGPPGAGKSTISWRLSDALNAQGMAAKVVPMDGFHIDDVILDQMDWRARKGAPHTYDVEGLYSLLQRLRTAGQGDIFYPIFDRASESSRAAAGRVTPQDRIILVEGNYLLLDAPQWRDIAALFDFTIMVVAPMDELERRLLDRWSGLGPDAARAKVEGNDFVNARLIMSKSLAADITIAV